MTGTRSTNCARVLGVAAVAAFAAACAVQERPSGGPEDKAAPRIESSVPARDSVNVAPDSPVSVSFSEDMSRTRVERLVTFQPAITMGSVDWEGRTLVIHPEGGLQRDTTYVVRVKPGYRDRHGVTGTETYQFAFATGASIDTARIEGSVFFKREPSGKAVVWAFRLPFAPGAGPESARPDREASTMRDGRFVLTHLPSHDARFVVLGFIDVNGNGSFDRSSEPYTQLADTLTLTANMWRIEGVRIDVIDPNEPGTLRGTVVNETGVDSLAATVAFYASIDSTRAAMLVRVDSLGAYAIDRVKPGDYLVRAFLDLRADSTCGTYPCPDDSTRNCAEPCARLPGTVKVGPGESVEVPALRLRRPEER